jgi:predicted amidohydrolase YtcJ
VELDLVIRDANIITMDPARPAARRLGVWHGRVAGVDAQIDGLPARATVSLAGRTVVPGFLDAHAHLAWAGIAARSTSLASCRSAPEALAEIGRAALAVPEGGWVDINGYDQRPLGRHLTRHDLDPVAAGRKLFILHASGHASLVNSLVTDLLPARGWQSRPGVTLGGDGQPSGLFTEDATTLIARLRNPYSLAELTSALSAAAAQCAAQGVTFCAEAGLGGGLSSRSPVEALAFQQAQAGPGFGIRVQLMMAKEMFAAVSAAPGDDVTQAFPLGFRTGLGSPRLSLGALKIWLDGGMMARTAALTSPYAGTGNTGMLADDLPEVAQLAEDAHAAGWQLALHAIGDAAIDAALGIFARAQRRAPRPDARHRIEHAGLIRPDQLTRLRELGVIAVTQPSFLYEYGADYAAIVGPQRSDWLYRGRSLLDAGVTLAGSSDRPVAGGAPLRAMQFMVERRTSGGLPVGPGEAITAQEALAAYTTGSAYACRVEDQLGSLSAGKLADLAVLSADPRRVPGGQIGEIEVLATAVAGQLVHGGVAHRDGRMPLIPTAGSRWAA